MTRKYATLALLAHGPLTRAEFVAITGWSKSACARILSGFVDTGEVHQPCWGVYALGAKVCQVCKMKFIPDLPGAVVCSEPCAMAYAVSVNGKAKKVAAVKERKATTEKLNKLKSNATLAAEAQAVVNKYVRLRDAHLGCVSCDKPASWNGQWHASHFRSVGAASGLRFNLWNIHKACSVCNNHLSGNIANYAPRLVEKIGADKVDWLYTQNMVKRSDAAYLVRIKRVFARKVLRLVKRMREEA